MVSIPVVEDPEAVARIARPIDDELDELIDLIGNARFVLLGEASHGTHEFYDLRAQLTRRLIAHCGFAAVTTCADWPDTLRVDRYARQLGDDETANDALSNLRRFPQWRWRNRDVEAFVGWLRAFNDLRIPETRVGFYGLDVHSRHASLAAVLSYLDQIDPDAAAVAREQYAVFDHAPDDPRRHDGHSHFGVAPDCEAELIMHLVEMQRRRTARSGRGPGGGAWSSAIGHARLVRDAEAYYRSMFGSPTEVWNLRENHMANTLDMLAEHLGQEGKPAKLIVWAHNSHVGDARATWMGHEGQTSLGTLTRERHGDEVALVGFSTHAGTVACARDWDAPGRDERVPPAVPGSWEALFHDAGIPRFLVTSTALKRVLGGRAERLHRAIGVVYWPDTELQSHYYPSRLADQYDLVVHIDDTQAVEPLGPVEPRVARGLEAPETDPPGI